VGAGIKGVVILKNQQRFIGGLIGENFEID
jgi:hypothetical protein